MNAHDHDEDGFEAPNSAPPRRQSQPVPNSPPPSFHSRASSRDRRGVDPALADAFDTDGDDSDDDADDRQRLVRADSTQASRDASRNPSSESRPQPERHVTQLPPTASTTAGGPTTPFRIYGSGIQNEGVFSNLTAKPERGGEVKEEQPPVRRINPQGQNTRDLERILTENRRTSRPLPMPLPPTGKPRSSPLASAAPTKSTSTACPWAHSSVLSGTA